MFCLLARRIRYTLLYASRHENKRDVVGFFLIYIYLDYLYFSRVTDVCPVACVFVCYITENIINGSNALE